MPGSFPSGAGGSASASTPRPALNSGDSDSSLKFQVDQSQPTTSVQIRLADGTRCVQGILGIWVCFSESISSRIVCRMNLTHTVLDIRNFINACVKGPRDSVTSADFSLPSRSRPENLTRPYTIGTTFPNRTLDDNSATIESAGLSNSVVVQRWA